MAQLHSLARVNTRELKFPQSEIHSMRGFSLSLASTSNNETTSLDGIWGWVATPATGWWGIDVDESFNWFMEQDPEDLNWFKILSSESDNSGPILVPVDSSEVNSSNYVTLALEPNEEFSSLFDGVGLVSRFESNNPVYDDSVLHGLFANSEYEITSIESVNFQNSEPAPSQDIPESSSLLGIFVLGAIAIGWFIKYRFRETMS